MPLPQIAIVGRPNVGKSSLFNWLTRRRTSIVESTAGVTRDRVSAELDIEDRICELIDTGGMGIEDKDGLTEDVEKQIRIAIESADLILFTVDAQIGMAPLDKLVAAKLRSAGVPIILVVNKCDILKHQQAGEADFVGLGLPMVFTSVTHNLNRFDLYEAILERLPPPDPLESPDRPELKIAIVGKRNAGKSTLVNTLAGMDRMIVSEVAGTTRDSVDVRFEHRGRVFVAIDTAGVRRKRALNQDSIEFYSFVRAQESIRRADMVIVLIDAMEPLGNVDKQLVHYVVEHHKPLLFVFNKWDLVQPKNSEAFSEYLDDIFPMLKYVPRVFITAKTGRNVEALIDLTQAIRKQAESRVSTGELNRMVKAAMQQHAPPIRGGRTGRVYYVTQAGVCPPTIVLFVNDPANFPPAWRAYLANYLRDRTPFEEIPIRIEFRKREAGAGGFVSREGVTVDGKPLEADGLAEPEGSGADAAFDPEAGEPFEASFDDDEELSESLLDEDEDGLDEPGDESEHPPRGSGKSGVRDEEPGDAADELPEE